MDWLLLIQKSYYSVLIGKYEPSLPFARQNVEIDDHIEQNIIATLQGLCLRFVSVK
ncbi:hypothetical protein [Brevibacillus laterosporus]|uniref:hypothetical protein n=1 Tax=Brevibacillus laterosporus TaxID=1465 RepID=UPI003D22941F